MRKLIIALVIICLGLASYLAYSNRTNTATDKSITKTSNPGSATSAQNDLLPVTTTPSVPDTSDVNSPGNTGQDIQSQPDSTPNTASPQQAAPTSPEQANEPAQPETNPNAPHCGTCGGGGFRKTQIACPMYCVN